MLSELCLIEILVAFGVLLTEVGEAVDGDLSCIRGRVTLIDKRDSVLKRQIKNGGNVVWLHVC